MPVQTIFENLEAGLSVREITEIFDVTRRASAFAEQLAAWDRLKQRAAKGRREEYLNVLDKVPDVEPKGYDRI